MLSVLKPVEVGSILDIKFPNPDTLDCDYLDDILDEIQNDTAEGFGYNPEQVNGLDYNHQAERTMQTNLNSSYRWLIRNRTRITQTPTQPVPSPSVPSLNSAPSLPVPLPWLGQVADLAEILHRLERGGVISLRDYFDRKGKGTDLCRGFASIFAFKEEKAIENLNGYLSHLKKAVGPGEINWEIMRKIGRKRGGKMGDMMPDETP